MGTIEKTDAALHTHRDARFGQSHLKVFAKSIGSDQHCHLIVGSTVSVEGHDLLCDSERLIQVFLVVVHLRHLGTSMGSKHLLRMRTTIFTIVDYLEGQINDTFQGSVIVTDAVYRSIRVICGEVSDELHIAAPEAVNALSLIANGSQTVDAFYQFVDDIILELVDILILVNKYMGEVGVEPAACLGSIQQLIEFYQ